VYAGEIVEYGSLRDIFTRAAHPYTRGLFGALPDLEKDVDRLQPIKGMPVDPTNLPRGCKFGPRCPYVSDKCLSDEIPYEQLDGKHKTKCLCTGFLSHAVGKGGKTL
jgi:peptide/nickel transport system ATP-binding protein